MIPGLSSTVPTLKTLEFKPGLNVLLSNTVAPEISGKTGNGAGKSSFVTIADFLPFPKYKGRRTGRRHGYGND